MEGQTQAITATALKLARIVFHLLANKETYWESVFKRCEEGAQRRTELLLRRHAPQLGSQLIPAVNQQ